MINKKRNVNLQLTISKESNNKLLNIQTELLNDFGLNLTKSQTIEYLINKYGVEQPKQEKTETKTSAQINALKDKLNVSYPKLAEIVGIPTTNLKRYAYGEQEPNEENKILLEKALKKYEIKV